MNPARLMLFALVPLLALNFVLWAFWAREIFVAILWPLLGIATGYLTDWTERHGGLQR